jgi:predicted membrane protein DUF2232
MNIILLTSFCGLVAGGLAAISSSEPILALPAAGFAAALIANTAKKISWQITLIPILVLSAVLILTNGLSWVTIVFISCFITGCVWPILEKKKFETDDRLFLPLFIMVAGVGTLLLIKHIFGGQIENFSTFSGLRPFLEKFREISRETSEQFSGKDKRDYLELIKSLNRNIPYYFTGILIASFTLILNFIMRSLHAKGEAVESILFFKIKERYVFLLIFAMGVEIFRFIFDQEILLYISRPIFVLVGIIYFLAGMAVIGFVIISRRSGKNPFFSRWIIFSVIFIIIIKPVLCSVIGLLDIWFDFRKLRILKGGFGK